MQYLFCVPDTPPAFRLTVCYGSRLVTLRRIDKRAGREMTRALRDASFDVAEARRRGYPRDDFCSPNREAGRDLGNAERSA